jgi:hypothetical protein
MPCCVSFTTLLSSSSSSSYCQVLDSSLEAHVLKSDNSGLAKDCRKEIKALNAQLMKLGPR